MPKPRRAPSSPGASLPAFDERRFRYAELQSLAPMLDPDELSNMVCDGRETVRANVALALAVIGHPSSHLVTLLRDSETRVATAAAEAISRLGPRVAGLIPDIVKALGGAQPQVRDWVVATFSELIGKADSQLVAALDVSDELAQKTVVESCARAGRAGVGLLIQAAGHERSRIRINAVGGLERVGKNDPEAAVTLLTRLEENDPVPDVRTRAKKSILAIIAPGPDQIEDALPKDIPDFEERRLAVSELMEYEDAITVGAMISALSDGRKHVRVNACRALGVKGDDAARAAKSMALLLRDSVTQVRREAARAFGKIPEGAVIAADELVGALGDAEEEVAEAASEALEPLGDRVLDALIGGLETGEEEHGRRVVELIDLLPEASEVLTQAFASPAVNVQVNAALGLGLLGAGRVGAGRQALLEARTGGHARTREAVRNALEMIDGPGDTGPAPIDVDGFESRFLGPEAFADSLVSLDIEDLIAYLRDGRDAVRANAATALGALGSAAASASQPLGVLLRDDSDRVRLAAAHALDKLGDDCVRSEADDLVRALGDFEEKVARACAAVLEARKARVLGALLRGLETDDRTHARRILALINLMPDASEILQEAFESPAVNVQVNAAMGMGMLGPKRLGSGRKSLEGARTGGHARTREAVREALQVLDGPGDTGPGTIEVEGFESLFLGSEAFTKVASSLELDDLIAYLQDGRAVVRHNAATALGVVGSAAARASRPLGVLLRDDDPRVRKSAALAVDKLGDQAVKDTADALVGALGDSEEDVAKVCQDVLKARKARMLSALLRGLETDDPTHGRRILELINLLPDACEVLCDAFESPAVNVQVNAAIGIGMLGAKRAGRAGRRALEGARTGGYAQTRDAVFKALDMLDGKA